jgi:hypothetical protein
MDWKDEPERPGWFGRLHLSWPMLLLAGWLLYEFTAQPGLAALVACAKFGWADVRTAFWPRRVDPDRRRGQTCFWCYLTFGLWKVAVMASMTMIALGFLRSIVDRVPPQPAAKNGVSPVLTGALAAAMGFGLSFPTTYIALWSALRNKVRIWLGHAPTRARKERFWPPRHGELNAAFFVAGTCLIMTLYLTIALAVLLAPLLQPGGFGLLFLLLGTPAAIVILMILLFRLWGRMIARSPQECWVAEEGEEVYQIRTAEKSGNEA